VDASDESYLVRARFSSRLMTTVSTFTTVTDGAGTQPLRHLTRHIERHRELHMPRHHRGLGAAGDVGVGGLRRGAGLIRWRDLGADGVGRGAAQADR